jgi:hypothetical protein
VIAIALSLQAGCFPERWSPTTHKVAYVVDGGFFVLGAVTLVGSECSSDHICQGVSNAIGFLSIGTAVVGAAINYWMGDSSTDEAAPAAATAPSAGPSSPIPGLDQFAVEATADARLGHCDAARVPLRRIFREDRAFFDQLVAADPALARCLR